MQRTFTVVCACGHRFPVDYGIRFEPVELECPNCRSTFTVDQAVSVDERWV